jgi:hypothetical protein
VGSGHQKPSEAQQGNVDYLQRGNNNENAFIVSKLLRPSPFSQSKPTTKINKNNLKQSHSGKLNISRHDTVKLSVNIR